jgi:hypothetical protein
MKIKILTLLSSLLLIMACKKDAALTVPTPPVTQSTLIPVPNGDFENWKFRGGSVNPLLSWKTPDCIPCVGPADSYEVKPDSQTVYHGKYSAKFIVYGASRAFAINKFACSYHPTCLQAYVKDTMVNATDSVLIKIDVFYQNNRVDSGKWMATSNITTYSLINIPITQNHALADTIIITVLGSCALDPLQSGPLWIDNVALYR